MLEPLRRAVNAARASLRAGVRAGLGAVTARFGWRPLFWTVVLALLALVLDAVPLFDVLGYDFSFAVGLAAALAAVDVGHGTVARWREAQAVGGAAPAADPSTVATLVVRAIGRGLALLVVPLVLSLANTVRVRNCSLPVGLAFFALLPVATVIYAAPAGAA